jgi:hypothetical protein
MIPMKLITDQPAADAAFIAAGDGRLTAALAAMPHRPPRPRGLDRKALRAKAERQESARRPWADPRLWDAC